jgi:uncharacterized protein YcgI (DUF1989 family)
MVRQGQRLEVFGTTIADFVCFNADNLRERFDQARTKANQGKFFISTGDVLYSRFNRVMLTILADGFREGHHDLQEGMCSAERYRLGLQLGTLAHTYGRPFTAETIPDHGCTENLSAALAPYGIAPEDIPSPFNLFQHMEMDCLSGRMRHTTVRPRPGTSIRFRAEMNLLCAISACPDLAVGARPITVEVGD